MFSYMLCLMAIFTDSLQLHPNHSGIVLRSKSTDLATIEIANNDDIERGTAFIVHPCASYMTKPDRKFISIQPKYHAEN